MNPRIKLFLHIFFWLAVEATWYQHIYFNQILEPGDLEWVIATHFLHLITFYTFYFLLFLKTRQTLKVFIYIVAYFSICLLRDQGLDLLRVFVGSSQFCSLSHSTWSTFFETFMFGVHGTFIALIESSIKFEKLKKELSEQNMKSELAFLRSQINPHFLYNTLNNIYSLSYPQSPQAAQAVMKLSEIMRYGLTEATQKLVPLKEEAEYLNSYISLEKMRYRTNTNINFTMEGEFSDKEIAPMIFIPFVENACKHGITDDPEKPVTILLKIEKYVLFFEVSNHYDKGGQKAEESGIGLKNVQRRLELIYDKKFNLEVFDDTHKSIFSIKLKIEF